MKTNECLRFVTLVTGFLAISANAGEDPIKTPPADADSPPRVGIYDSRSVATAYCGTPRHEAEIQRLDAALKKAKAAGDPAQIKQADKAVWDARKRLHRQGFGTAPVDDILAQIPQELARLKTEMRVKVLVSKWDGQRLVQYKQAEKLDVTEKLIDALKPNERQRRYATEIQKHKPISPIILELLLLKEAH